MRNISISEPPRRNTVCPAIIGEVEDVRRRMKTDEHGDRVAALVGDARSLRATWSDDAAQQREGRVGDEVVEQVRAAGARCGSRRTSAQARPIATAGRRAEQRHRQHEPEERAADPEALGVERRGSRCPARARPAARPAPAAATAPRSTAARRPRSTTTSRTTRPITTMRSRCAAAAAGSDAAAAARAGLGARTRARAPAARMSASDQATITSHRTTASQTITDRKVVPRSPGCHRSSDWA